MNSPFAPLHVKETQRHPATLALGMELAHVGYTWRPFEERPPDHQLDFTALFHHMRTSGKLLNPLIVFRDHVLIGQRRCEIARLLNWSTVPCWEIVEDITNDPNADRVLALRDKYQPVDYTTTTTKDEGD